MLKLTISHLIFALLFFACYLSVFAQGPERNNVASTSCGIEIVKDEKVQVQTSRLGIIKILVTCNNDFFDIYKRTYLNLSKSPRASVSLDPAVEKFSSDISDSVICSTLQSKKEELFDADGAHWVVSASSWFHPIKTNSIESGKYFMWVTCETIDQNGRNLESNEIEIWIE